MNSPAAVLPRGVLDAIRQVAFNAMAQLRRHSYDRQDIEQELILHFLMRRHRFDAKRATAPTFAAHICRNRALQMLEKATATKRGGGRRTEALSGPVTPDSHLTYSDVLSEDAAEIRQGRSSWSAVELQNLRLDIERAIDCLPQELAVLAHLLYKGESMTTVVAILGLSAATVYRRLSRLREAFHQAGLHAYLTSRRAA